jgi:hypothetical protein
MQLSRRAFLLAPVMLAPALARPALGKRLWDGARYTHADKARAVRRGLEFIYKTAKDRKNFAEYGSDYLWCFYTVASTTSDPDLKARAGKMAQERAREWRRIHPRVPDKADAEDVSDLVFGALAADSLGVRNDTMKRDLERAARRFGPQDLSLYTSPSPRDYAASRMPSSA